jgi:hypothetical protein
MGELLKTTYPDMTNRCRECGKLEGEDGDDFIHTFDEMMDLSEEEKMACEWFSEQMGDKPFPDMTQMAHHYTREEMIHIFVLEHLIDKLMAKKPICETCFSRKRGEKVLS